MAHRRTDHRHHPMVARGGAQRVQPGVVDAAGVIGEHIGDGGIGGQRRWVVSGQEKFR